MASKMKHKLRSHKTYRFHLMNAVRFCHYHLTREERLMMRYGRY